MQWKLTPVSLLGSRSIAEIRKSESVAQLASWVTRSLHWGQALKAKLLRERLLASSMICGAAVGLLAASQAAAQTVTQPEETEVEEIVVTGSLFRRTDTETPSPVTVMTSENLQRAGLTTATDAIRSVSADGAGSIGTGFQSGFSAGGSAVSLRGLGVSSTLVLIDGLRSANFPINDDGHNAYVDLNSIPFSLIERIEVLKDGASSTYGADAIGGVVNLILKQQFSGVEGSAEFGQSQERDARHRAFDLDPGLWRLRREGLERLYQRRVPEGRPGHQPQPRLPPITPRICGSIGGLDNNTADSTLTTATPTAVVVRTTQSDLNNPLSGGLSPFADGTYLDPPARRRATATSPRWAWALRSAAPTPPRPAAARHGLQVRTWSISTTRSRRCRSATRSTDRLSFTFNENVEGYVTGSYLARLRQHQEPAPRAAANTQPFGGSPAAGLDQPRHRAAGLCLLVGRQLRHGRRPPPEPEQPLRRRLRRRSGQRRARIYYLFGDIPAGSDRTNEVYPRHRRPERQLRRRLELAASRPVGASRRAGRSSSTASSNIANLLNVDQHRQLQLRDPSAEHARRSATSSRRTEITPSHSTLYSLDASDGRVSCGPCRAARCSSPWAPRSARRNWSTTTRTPRWTPTALTTSSAFGKHTVSAGYFELQARRSSTVLDINASGRYDHYSRRLRPLLAQGRRASSRRSAARRSRHLFARASAPPTFAESGRALAICRLLDHHPSRHASRLAHGGTTNPYQPCLFGRSRLRRQSGPGAGNLAQLHRRSDLRAVQVAEHDGRLLQREEVEPDRQRP